MGKDRKQLEKIRSGLFARSFSIAKMTLQAGSQLATNRLSSLLVTEEEKTQKWLEFLKKQSEMFGKEVGELKGSLMKAGQMLTMYAEHFLPEGSHDALKKLYSQSPPLQWPEIEKILKQELNEQQLKQLNIDPVCIGSASLGQVHKAQIQESGEWIALKIQYPGVDKAIESDLKVLQTFLGMLNIFPRGYDMNAMFCEIREMMQQEVNYTFEAEQTELYRKMLAGDPRFVVPKVYAEFSTGKILATSFESGLPADSPTVQHLSQDRRNQLAMNFFDLYATEFYKWGLVQTDPHLGNYKIRLHPNEQDQIVLLDFGAVRKYDPAFLASYRKMITAILHNNEPLIEQATLELNFIGPQTSPKVRTDFINFCKLTVEPFRGGVYDFAQTDLPERLTKNIFKLIRSYELNPPPKEVIFLDRKTGGVFIFLTILKAKFDAKLILQSYIKY